MSCSNSILTRKTSVGEIRKSESFSEEHVPSSKSIMSEKREIRKSESFPEEHVVDIDLPPCVFRVPKSLSETKPEAYVPQKLGLGPFHHFRPDLYTMQRKKFSDVLEFIDADEEDGHQNIRWVLHRLSGQQNLLGGNYDHSPNLDYSVLVKIVAIDAIYLLSYLHHHHHHQEDIYTDPEMMKILAGDILMLENQIPGHLLLEIWRDIKLGDLDVLSKNIIAFCVKESPLKILTEQPDDILPLMRQGHLLNVLYNLILQPDGRLIRRWRTTCLFSVEKAKRKEEIAKQIRIHGAAEIRAKFGGGAGSSKDGSKGSEPPACPHVDLTRLADAVSGVHLQEAAIVHKELSIMQKLPWAEFFNLLKRIDPDREENYSPVEEIRIPSASLLSGNAGISFDVAKKGIRDIRFDKPTRTLYLPALTLHSNSEVILRNLMAFEAAITKPRSTLEFAEYVDLMCGIVDTPEDVRTLHQAGIIDGDLKSAEIVQIFNGIRRSTVYEDQNKDWDKHKRNIREVIKDVNEYYASRPNVTARRWLAKPIYTSWKFFTIFSTAMIVMLLALQAFCEIYDCNKHLSPMNKYINPPSRFFDQVGSLFPM